MPIHIFRLYHILTVASTLLVFFNCRWRG